MGGDPAAKPTGESTDATLAAFSKYLPQLLGTTASNILPTAQAEQAAYAATAPAQAQTAANLFSQYAPQYAAVGNKINAADKLSSAQSDLDVLQGPGKKLATEATALGKDVIDPEFYKTREALGNKATGLINSYDPNGLSGSERAEVERGLNQNDASSGNLGTNSAINTVERGMGFGSALNSKKVAIGQAINQVGSILGSFKSGIDPFGRTQVNSGEGQFQQPQALGKEATNSGASQLLGVTSGFQNQFNDITANRRDSLDRVSQVLGSLPSVSG